MRLGYETWSKKRLLKRFKKREGVLNASLHKVYLILLRIPYYYYLTLYLKSIKLKV